MTIIIGRRWYNNSTGNTYHSVSVNVDGKFVGRVDYAYGYGDQYKQTALTILQNAGLWRKTNGRLASGISKDGYEFEQHMRENPEEYFVTVADVARKRDL